MKICFKKIVLFGLMSFVFMFFGIEIFAQSKESVYNTVIEADCIQFDIIDFELPMYSNDELIQQEHSKVISTSTKKQIAGTSINITYDKEFQAQVFFNENEFVDLTGILWKSSLIFPNNIWVNGISNSKYFELITFDMIDVADETYLLEENHEFLGKTLVRVVFINHLESKVYHLISEISKELYVSLNRKATSLTYDDILFENYRNAVLLNHSYFISNFPYEDTDTSDLSLDFTPNKPDDDTIKTMTITSNYGSTARGTMYIPEYDLTITDWGLNFLLDSIFPSRDILPKLIDQYQYNIIKKLDSNHYQYITEYSWVNNLYPNYRNVIYMEYELIGAVDGILITLKYADWYRYFPSTRELLYSGISGNAWLQDFFFRLYGDEPINYLRVSNAGLWAWPDINFNPSTFVMEAIFSIGSIFSLNNAELIISSFSDPGGYASLNEEFQIENHTLIYNQYNYNPINTSTLSFVLDPKWVMRIEPPKVAHTTMQSRWKQFSIDIRYNAMVGDTPPETYKYIVNFKRHVVYSTSQYNQPILDLTLQGGTLLYIIPVGC